MYTNEIDTIKHQLINEYAGYQDKKSLIDNFPKYTRYKNSNEFYFHMTKYLNKFQDPHLKIHNTKSLHPNIRVQLFENHLYIIDSKNQNLPTGTLIKMLGKSTVEEVLNKDKDLLKSSNPERMDWTDVLKKYEYVTTGNQIISILQKDNPNFFDQSYQIEERKTYLYIRFSDFLDHTKISRLIKQNKNLILNANQIIIDVRGNRGGSDLAFFELLPLLINNDITIKNEFPYYHRFTKAYCDERLEVLSEIINQISDSKEIDEYKTFSKLFKDNYDKGLVNINYEQETKVIKGINNALPNVKVLCDFECGSSGESFVEIVQRFTNIEVIGRPTRGMNDYSNVMIINLNDNFILSVPHSKDGRIDTGKSMAKNGISVNYYVPWTPKELNEDVILNIAINQLSNINQN
ncbi:S41 family peptidase [Mammaliicoccus sp. G-M28]|uniref:S41 family peptidase n=1 Tax=Mammaliicoccus sp. G-M28 TaxID=2898688 RepID=UPI001EFBE3A4|nr:S41 family peptidase [Mammaliicoccus sp. G-M28]